MNILPTNVATALSSYIKRWRWALIFNGALLAGLGVVLAAQNLGPMELAPARGVWLVALGLAMVAHGAILGWHGPEAAGSAQKSTPIQARPVGRIVAASVGALLLGAAIGQLWVAKIESRRERPYSSAAMAKEASPIAEALAMVGGDLLICEPGQGWQIEAVIKTQILTFKSSDSHFFSENVACPTTRVRYSVAKNGSAYAGRDLYSYETYLVDNGSDWLLKSEGDRRLAIAAIANQILERRNEIELEFTRQ